MKKTFIIPLVGAAFLAGSCGGPSGGEQESKADEATVQENAPGQKDVVDEESEPNVVKIAMASKDHSTLVAAIQAADLVNALSNNGPFTVFAPVNAAFEALPEGALDDLLKPENKAKLETVLYHHVQLGVMKEDWFTDGKQVDMFDGTPETITKKDGSLQIGGANVLGSVMASNGIVYIIDKVLLPKESN